MNMEFSAKVGNGATADMCTTSLSSPTAGSTEQIGSFAVLDLETNDLPNNWSKTAITELSIYAFTAKELDVQPLPTPMPPPATPRVLHKLTLLFNPRQRVNPVAEKVTGLSNEILEHESHFDENAANTVINFLKHLQQPVCLVAHNGNAFDFLIVKHSFEKLQMHLPSNVMCLDSLRAFVDIDKQLESAASLSLAEWSDDDIQIVSEDVPATIRTNRCSAPIVEPIDAALPVQSNGMQVGEVTSLATVEDEIDWRLHNETTPKRPPTSTSSARAKRSRAALDCNSNADSTPKKGRLREGVSLSACRALFQTPGTWRYPPKNVYKLSNIFERKFGQSPAQAHHAEADVDMLMKLMQTYGVQFLAYAQNHAIPFAAVRSRLAKPASLQANVMLS